MSEGRPRVHNRRAGTAPPGAVYVGRGSQWGNPFRIGRDGDRDEVIRRFECEILPTLDVRPLIGKHLICYCAPARCHGDALLRAARDAAEAISSRAIVDSGLDGPAFRALVDRARMPQGCVIYAPAIWRHAEAEGGGYWQQIGGHWQVSGVAHGVFLGARFDGG